MKQTRIVLGTKKIVMLNRSKDKVMLMEAITEEQEELIDKNKLGESTNKFKSKDGFIIPSDDIYLYGNVNFEDENDIKFINKHHIVTDEVYEANKIPSDFNYEKGIITSDERGIFKIYDTWNKLDWFKYNYCLLGKPKRIVIYSLNKERYIIYCITGKK